jgi:hypothetical protein
LPVCGRDGRWVREPATNRPLSTRCCFSRFPKPAIQIAISGPLLLDNTAIGDTAPHTYVFKEVTPGKHTIVSKTENDVSLDINAQPGQTYYVWQEVKVGVWTARSALHQVDEKTGQQAVKDCKLIQ